MIRAYLDESGIGRSDEVCIVAGWIGSTKQWAMFEERWQRASKGVVFHGTEFFRRDDKGKRLGPYAGWTDNQAKEYVDALLGVLERGNVTAFGTMVDVRAFMELTETQRHYLTGRMFHRRKDKWTMTGAPNSPYFLGFTETLMDIAERVKKPGWLVDLVCDRQENYA